MKAAKSHIIPLVLAALLATSSFCLAEVATIREGTAAGPQANAQSGIQSTVDAFRSDLGGANNGNAVGSEDSGRREVSWDGADNDAAPARLPSDFYNAIAPRGIKFRCIDVSDPENESDARGQFQVSADSTPAVLGTSAEFGNINATYPTAFSAFSSPRLFTCLNSYVIELDFFVPGTNQPAAVSGFGALFTDVDVSSTTSMEFFDADNNSLFSRNVLATSGNESLSFLGVSFTDSEVARVRITLGNSTVGANDITQGSSVDIVVLDNLIYGEPQLITSSSPDFGQLTKPVITKLNKKQITVSMDDFGSSVGYFLRSTCRLGSRRLISSNIYFSNSITIKKPRGKGCRFRYSIISGGSESDSSPVGK